MAPTPGIPQLLQRIPHATKKDTPLDKLELKGKKAGIDMSCWLHRSIRTCAYSVSKGEEDQWLTKGTKFIRRALVAVKKLGMIPIVVFDGDRLPMVYTCTIDPLMNIYVNIMHKHTH